MCGIVGYFDIDSNSCLQGRSLEQGQALRNQSEARSQRPTLESAVRRAMQCMESRGPHDAGTYSMPGVMFGHRRLAVIDLQGGHQPLVDKATGVVLVFNGEIFNYRELRNELAANGHTFETNSDSEVLLQSYLRWDIACLEHLAGMFAFGIYDPRRRRLFLARDRLGIKPLFFSFKGTYVMFASTCPALRCFPDIDSHMDLVAASHYLSTIRTTLGRRTLLRDVQTLLPGEYLVAAAGDSRPTIDRYWEIPVVAPGDKEDPGIETAAGHVRELLTDSVKHRLISDVPLGSFLSGGIDSSIMASIACRLTSRKFGAYSVGYDRSGYNEWPYVRSAAEFHGMDCHEIHLDEEGYAEDRAKLVRFKGLPISTPNEIPIYRLARSLNQDFTVALSGEGADEVFGGYTIPYFSAFDYERALHSAPESGQHLTPVDRAMRRLYRRPYLLCRPDHYFLINSWIPFSQKQSLLNNGVWEAIDRDAELFGFYESLFERLETCSTFDAYMHIHARVNMEGLLSRVDSSTMAASVEARVPFTDHRIVEYMFRLPDHYKMDWKDGRAREASVDLNVAEIDKLGLLESKILLRRAFRHDVPPAILERPKVSFPVPFREWLAGPMRSISESMLRESPLTGGLFDRAQVERLLRTPDRPQSAMALWPLTNLCLWQQECNVQLP